MKVKTIKQVLRKKFDEYVESINDPVVKELVKRNSIITGGCIASMLLCEDVNDYDIYFTDKQTVLAVSHYYVNEFKKLSDDPPVFHIIDGGSSDGDETDLGVDEDRVLIRVVSAGVASEDGFVFSEGYDDDEETTEKVVTSDDKKAPYRPVFISANAITLADDVQLIIRFYGDVDTIHENYDFAHCTCSWESAGGALTTPTEALECLLARELRYNGSKYPLASIIRSRKFINRGFRINAGQYLKMCLQLNDLDLTDLVVLEDQLSGVDAYYFNQMISAIPDSAKEGGVVDSDYVIVMVNKFF